MQKLYLPKKNVRPSKEKMFDVWFLPIRGGAPLFSIFYFYKMAENDFVQLSVDHHDFKGCVIASSPEERAGVTPHHIYNSRTFAITVQYIFTSAVLIHGDPRPSYTSHAQSFYTDNDTDIASETTLLSLCHSAYCGEDTYTERYGCEKYRS